MNKDNNFLFHSLYFFLNFGKEVEKSIIKYEPFPDVCLISSGQCPNLDGPLPVSLEALENLKGIYFMYNSFKGTN